MPENDQHREPQLAVLDAVLDYLGRGFRVLPLETVDEEGVCSCRRPSCSSPGKHPASALTPNGLKDASNLPTVAGEWWHEHPEMNVGIATGRASGLVAIDVDPDKGGAVSLEALEAEHGPLPRTPTVDTGGGGRHFYFAYPKDGEVRNSVSKLAPGIDVRGEGGYVVAPPSRHASGRRYGWVVSPQQAPLQPLPEWVCRPDAARGRVDEAPSGPVHEGSRNDHLFRLGCALRARGAGRPVIAAALHAENQDRCEPPLSDEEVDRTVAQAFAYPAGTSVGPSSVATGSSVSPGPAARPRMDPMGDDAFYGPAGDFVGVVGPHTEASREALLVVFLCQAGNLVGRWAYASVGADRHFPNLDVALVGPTSSGRKGTAVSEVRRAVAPADPLWASECIVSGLSSGEGLIHAVRDKVTKTNKDGEEVVVDGGVDDKRLMVIEPEFARTLGVAGRDGNTLSSLIRVGWDGGTLRSLTRHSPAKATDPHISIIAQITPEELDRRFTTTEMANGLANRFLWIWTERSRLLPRGGSLVETDLAPIADALRAASSFTVFGTPRDKGIRRAPDFWDLWDPEYARLTADRPGFLGAITARATSQVLRLALVYAILDCSVTLREVHLRAALAVWDYCERSAEAIFGGTLGDPTADEIDRALQRSPAGLTRTEINRTLSGHQSSRSIDAALAALERAGRATSRRERTGGRDTERWHAVRKKPNKRNELDQASRPAASSASSAFSAPEPPADVDQDREQ